MALALALQDMTQEEKLEAMVLLWEDLRKRGDALESPSWHGEVLMEREQSITESTTRFIDWETAKAALDLNPTTDQSE